MLNMVIGLMVMVIGSGVIYQIVIAPILWMKRHGDGLYNARIRFNKKNLGVKKDDSY